MGLDKVVDNIRNEGRSQASTIVDAARKEADAILADAKRQAAEITARRQTEGSTAADALLKREVASAELESRRLRLAAERELVSSIRTEVERKLAALPASSREAHLKALIAKANVTGGKVWVSKQDEASAHKLGLQVAGTFEGLGGVIVESPDGHTRENLRYETLLDEIWQSSLPQVASKLLKH
ncbi:MAG TPA: V-type ATP synthase subunit E family protein [Candidatus Thermoplasmatota archaeon]|nr:V-type ATP synthase subunit E family protein [Candidatus Thermoplasmatota archaeon]